MAALQILSPFLVSAETAATSTIDNMLPLTKYCLCVFATLPVSELPLYILEYVEGDGKIAPASTNDRETDFMTLEKRIAEAPADLDPKSHDSDIDTTKVDARPPSNSAFVTMLVGVGMIQFYMLWQVISYQRQLTSQQQSWLDACIFWCMTLLSAGRLLYGISACPRYFVYVYRPHWLPQGVPLRDQALEAFAVALVVTMKLLAVVFAGVLAKMMLYDPLKKLVVLVIYRGESGSHDLK
jgi:hypothetical protein